MLIPLGFLAASGALAGDYELIGTTVIASSGTTSAVTFDVSALASKYKHLQLRWVISTGANNQSVFMRFNGDTGSNYAAHWVTSQGTTITNGSQLNTGAAFIGGIYNGTSATYPMSGITDVLDFASTTKNKTVRSISGVNATGTTSTEMALNSHFWNSTAAVTAVNWAIGGSTLNAGSRVSLYGIRG